MPPGRPPVLFFKTSSPFPRRVTAAPFSLKKRSPLLQNFHDALKVFFSSFLPDPLPLPPRVFQIAALFFSECQGRFVFSEESLSFFPPSSKEPCFSPFEREDVPSFSKNGFFQLRGKIFPPSFLSTSSEKKERSPYSVGGGERYGPFFFFFILCFPLSGETRRKSFSPRMPPEGGFPQEKRSSGVMATPLFFIFSWRQSEPPSFFLTSDLFFFSFRTQEEPLFPWEKNRYRVFLSLPFSLLSRLPHLPPS